VLRLDHIRDLDTMRQVAVLLERENDRLHAKLTALTRELSQLRGEDASAAQRQLEALKEILAHREQALFGDSSEKRPTPTTAAPAAAAPPQRGHGPKAQPALPIIDVVHELAVADRTCTACGGVLDEMTGQTEDSEEITVVERHFVMLRQLRKKYRCTCNGCIETAPGPLRLTARPDRRGRRYSADFAIEVAIGKYLDHLPLERQVRMMRREGLVIDSQTLWDQLDAAATILAPTYAALRRHVQAAPVIGADETWWRVLVGPGNTRWWAWSLTSETAVTYTILESRSQEAGRQVLNGYQGIVVADGYGAYEALARAGPRFTLAHCWAHVRRKFVEAEPHYPGPCAEVLDLIGQLYAVERECPPRVGPAPEAEASELRDQRARLRAERSTPLVAAIRAWALQQRTLPESGLGKAIAYMLGLWPGLTRFLDDPRIPLDNNATERALRGMVIGRKNHYGSRSRRGTEVAALFYSLIESAKLCSVEPKAYLLRALRAALAAPGTVTLPHTLAT
jgi:transposase